MAKNWFPTEPTQYTNLIGMNANCILHLETPLIDGIQNPVSLIGVTGTTFG